MKKIIPAFALALMSYSADAQSPKTSVVEHEFAIIKQKEPVVASPYDDKYSLPAQKKPSIPLVLDLKNAIELVLAHNYSLKADSLNILSADYHEKVAKAAFLPQANFAGKSEYNLAIPSQLLPGSMVGNPDKDLVPVQFGTRYHVGAGVEISQHLIRKDLRLQVNAAGLNRDIERTKHTLTKEEIVYQIAIAFYRLQMNAERIHTTSADHENMLDIVRIAKAQFDHGVLKRIDYESLQINAANKLSELNQMEANQKEQMIYFMYLLGIPVDADITIVPRGGTDIIQDSFTGSQANRQDIRLMEQLIEVKKTEIRSVEAENLPALSSYLKFNYQSQFNKPEKVFDSNARFKSSTVGLAVTIPVFDGYRRKNRLKIAQTELQQLKFQNLQKQELARSELLSAKETLSSDQQQYHITKENLVLAEKLFSSRKALYTEGVTSLMELLEAERELSQSRNLYMESMINMHASLVQVHKAKGTLLTDYLKSL